MQHTWGEALLQRKLIMTYDKNINRLIGIAQLASKLAASYIHPCTCQHRPQKNCTPSIQHHSQTLKEIFSVHVQSCEYDLQDQLLELIAAIIASLELHCTTKMVIVQSLPILIYTCISNKFVNCPQTDGNIACEYSCDYCISSYTSLIIILKTYYVLNIFGNTPIYSYKGIYFSLFTLCNQPLLLLYNNYAVKTIFTKHQN